MPKPKKPSSAGKKRKEIGEDNDKSGPPKKRCKKKYYCKAVRCTNQSQNVGVCVRHGAKVKRKVCSIDGCTNKVQNRGVCIRHGAYSYCKRCSSEGCTNLVVNRGVCRRHGASVKQCSVDGCTNQVQRRGVCRRHGAFRSPQEKIILCRDVQGEGNQNDESTVREISDDEEEEWKPKDQVSPSRAAARRSGRLSKRRKVYYDVEVANPKQDESDMTPPKGAGRRVNEEKAKGDLEEDASDVALTQEGEEGLSVAMEGGGNGGELGQNYIDFEGDANEDVNSAGGLQSEVVPVVIDVEIASEVQRLTIELKQSNQMVVTLKQQLKQMKKDLQRSELESLRDRLKLISSQMEEKDKRAASLEASLRSMEVKMHASAAQLEEANKEKKALCASLEEADKGGSEMVQRQINKFHSMQQQIRSLESENLRLKQRLKSSENRQARLRSALDEANALNSNLKSELDGANAKIHKFLRRSAGDSLGNLEV